MAATVTTNALLSSHQPSDVQVVLHPLVLLTISDYITRHNLRELPGPIVGGLLGLHRGREITIEHAFDCATVSGTDPTTATMIDSDRFNKRLEQFRTVHKDRKLDLVGWYTILPKSGPTPSILPTHLGLLELNDSVLLLAFHPDEATHQSAGAKLPLSVYESNYEVDEATKPEGDGASKKPEAGVQTSEDEDRKMEDGDAGLKLKFRELAYTVEAEESEMISMDFVAKGGGNATAVETKLPPKPAAGSSFSAPGGSSAQTASETTAKPTKRAKTGPGSPDADTDMESKAPEFLLSREEEEMISSFTAKANAIRMLQSRINVITKYLEQLPDVKTEMTDADAPTAGPSNAILRQIQALVSRLELLVPSDSEAFEAEMIRERNDVKLVTMLNDMVQSTISARETLRKFLIVETGKKHPNRSLSPGQMFVEDRRFDAMADGFI